MQPGRIAAPAGELPPLEEEADEHLLSRIFGVVLRAHEPPAHSPHPLAEAVHEHGERDAVGALASGLRREVLVGN